MKKMLMVVLDGFGIREEEKGNAIKKAKMNNFIKIWNDFPHCQLKASERAVGLSKGQMGNSDIGHLTIGAGRLVKKGYFQIAEMFNKNQLKDNEEYKNMVNYAKEYDKPIHLMALMSDGGVHSHIYFIYAMIQQLVYDQINKIYIHVITDGRDTKTNVSMTYIKELERIIKDLGAGEIVSVCGRYYAMDRDKNWDRTKKYYDLVTRNMGTTSINLGETIKKMYAENITDEFMLPISLTPDKNIKDGDCLLWFNYRSDRAKQIIQSFVDENFNEFPHYTMSKLKVFTLCPIDSKFSSRAILPELEIDNSLGIYFSKLGLTQARVAESEKYPHVTYFFDGGKEIKLPGCSSFHIPSPDVATYDLKPEMSAVAVTKTVIKCMENDFDFILVNFANLDMVGHTGNMEAATKACQAVDICLGKLIEEATENFYTMIILGDHGNAEYMIDENNKPVTTHTINPVPFIITDTKISLVDGDLTMVAPTVLKYMDIAIPKEMKETETLYANED